MSNNQIIVRFPNGFRLVFQKSFSDIHVSSIMGFVKLGSIYESDDMRGGSHFIEHMCFKGTSAMPKSKTIFKHFDKHGAYINAFTEKEYTLYTVKCDDDYMEECIHTISDMMLNSTFPKSQFNKEYSVVTEENIKAEDDMPVKINKMMESTVYENTPYANPIDDISYHRSGNPIDYSKMVEFYHQYYRPSNMVLSIITNKPISEIKRILKKSFFMKNIKSSYSHQLIQLQQIVVYPQINQLKINIERKSNLSATYLSFAFRTCPKDHSDEYPLYLLSQILGSTFSSQLFMLLREEHGLTYHSRCVSVFYTQSGHLEIYVELNPKKILKNHPKKTPGVLPILIHFLNLIFKNGILQKDINLFKGYVKGNHQILLENSDNICEYNGKKLLLENKTEFLSYDQIFDANYHSLGKSDIDRVIRTYMRPDNLSVSIIGTDLPSETLLKREIEKFGV
jgi:predicted Zn-dependent peptidase